MDRKSVDILPAGKKSIDFKPWQANEQKSLIWFWKHRKSILGPSPVGLSGPCRDFIPSPQVSLLWPSGSQCGGFYLWVKPGVLWVHQSGRSVISLEYWGGRNKDRYLRESDLAWNDPRYRKKARRKQNSWRKASLWWAAWIRLSLSLLPAPVTNQRGGCPCLLPLISLSLSLFLSRSFFNHCLHYSQQTQSLLWFFSG